MTVAPKFPEGHTTAVARSPKGDPEGGVAQSWASAARRSRLPKKPSLPRCAKPAVGVLYTTMNWRKEGGEEWNGHGHGRWWMDG